MSYREYEDIRHGLKELGSEIGGGILLGMACIAVSILGASCNMKLNKITIVHEQSAQAEGE